MERRLGLSSDFEGIGDECTRVESVELEVDLREVEVFMPEFHEASEEEEEEGRQCALFKELGAGRERELLTRRRARKRL